ncbi:MAG: hypothetical protein ABI862_11665, partial [Ilumatobacteraceae bacterium]
IAPEQAVLDRYVLLPHARSGIGAALDVPFAWMGPVRATVEMTVPIHDDVDHSDAKMTMHVYGPADVTELDHRQVIRTYPKADAHNAEVDDLVQVEFDRPEVPWLFTPAGPTAQGLTPWITLVVAESSTLVWGRQRGETRTASIRRDQLQPLRDAWAWAHAQVMGPKVPGPNEPSIDERLGRQNAPHNLSRLICPRRLRSETSYVACVVPTFLPGKEAGLGLTASDKLAPSWGLAENFDDGDPQSMIDLPVYFSWRFTTGEEGNFESLARKLKPEPAPPGVGRRRVDAAHPWPGAVGDNGGELTALSTGAEIVVEGPVVSPQDLVDDPVEHWPSESDQHWDASMINALISKLNRPDEQAHSSDPGPPLVGPPLYGSNHARQPRIETELAAAGSQPAWFRDVNLDPRHRIVDGLGTRVVQSEQEDLMLSAWNQVVGVEAANRALRMAQLAKHVSASLHRRHLSNFSDAAVVATTERVHGKLLQSPDRTIWAEVDSSALPATVTTGAFRRLTRIRGPVAKVAAPNLDRRVNWVESLTVRADHLSADWVLNYSNPDGVDGVGSLAKSRITDDMVARIAPGTDRDTLLAQWDETLAKPGPEQLLSPAVLEQADQHSLEISETILPSILTRLVQGAPTFHEISESEDLAAAGAARAEMIRSVVQVAAQSHLDRFELPLEDAKRLDLEVVDETDDGRKAVVTSDGLRSWAGRALEIARGSFDGLAFPEFENSGEQLRQRLVEGLIIEGGRLFEGLKAIAAKVIVDDQFADGDRSRLDAPGLALVTKLNPSITVPARIKARLTAGSGRLPGWLRPDWFDDLRIEPVMACPRFAYPMYEPLDRYDREWMVPGLGLMKQPDMATLLRTNNRFVEAYLVGLNHEMGRELLWREYPTDQRGTYFSSFWTRDTELVADMHEAQWLAGDVGAHVKPELDGQLVFLVRGDLIRRYPGVVAHAVRQARDGAGTLLSDPPGVPLLEPGSDTSPKKTLFHIHLPPNILLVGFALTEAEIRQADATWWFTLSENPTEPRFGLDSSREGGQPLPNVNPLPTGLRDALIWDDFQVAEGAFLDVTRPAILVIKDRLLEDCQWGASSAQVASLLFQLPARAVFLGTRMVDGVH